MTGLSILDLLLSSEGQRLLETLAGEPITAETEIALITRLRRSHARDLVAAAVEQTTLRAKASKKFARADRMYFTRAGLEQASSEPMSHHHAHRYEKYTAVADLCSGIGGDAIALAGAHPVTAVDRDPLHARLCHLNAAANDVGSSVTVVCADVRDLPPGEIGAAFVDPARRTADRRLPPGASEPPLSWCFALASAGTALGVKAAPTLPTDLVPAGWELEFVSEHGELKESLLWSPHLATTRRRATVLSGSFSRAKRDENLLLPVEHSLIQRPGAEATVKPPGAFLVDPDPSVTRAGLVAELAESLGDCWKIDERIGFLSANEAPSTPFGRTLRIEASAPWSLSRLRDALRGLDVGSVDIRKRGSAVDVEELHRRLPLRGERRATVVLTRVADRPWMFVCFEPS